MRVLHLVSCRGWSSDAYWAARVTRELERRGHQVRLGLRRGTEAAVLARARAEGVSHPDVFELASGVRPRRDAADVRHVRALLADTDVVHVHRGKEHWLAAVANRLAGTPRPLVRTRHIVHAVRPHAANRWLYGRATALVVTVSDAIRRQLVAAELVSPDRAVTVPGGADVDVYRPGPSDPDLRRTLGAAPDTLLAGLIAGFRVMKGHTTVVEAAARLAERGPRFVFVGRGSSEAAVREALLRDRLADRVRLTGFVEDVAAVMRALDIALYVPLESDGMSRVVFEYLAAGCPLIASRVGVVAEILGDGEHALLVPGGDVDALVSAIARLTGDPALRAKLARAGRALVESRYSGARVAEALESHYERLIGLASPARLP
jgi:glycosyltransferase involved in cell wall biosynthesis